MARHHRHKSRGPLLTHMPKILAGLAGAAVLAGGVYVATRKSPEDHLKAGIAMHQSGDLKGAAIELKNTLQAAPNNPDARYLLGRIHFSSGDYAAAEKELKKARELGNGDAELDAMLAKTLLALNQPKRVIEEVKTVEGGPAASNAGILALRARAHLLLDDVASAEKELSDAQSLSADHPETLVSRAYLALGQKKTDEALAFVDQALSKEAKRADLWVMKGDLLRLEKRREDAMAAYGKAMAIEPANIPARLAVAQLHLETNELDKADAALKELNKHAPNSVLGRYLQAFIEFRRSRFNEANAKLQDLLRSAPNFLPAHLLGGAVSLAIGNREAAKSHLNKFLEAAPDHPLARKLMAATLSDLGEVDKAKKILGTFDSAGSDPVLNTLRGEIALRQGEYAEARKHLEKMGDNAPQNPKYFTELAASRMGSGDEGGAIQALTKAAELDTASAKPDVLLVLSHLKEKRFDEAFRAVDKLEKERPNDPLIHNLRGTIHVTRDDKVQARASFAKALQIKPGYFPAASNLALLDIADKDPKTARSRFEQLLKHAPQESRAWLGLAALDAREKNEAGYLKNLEQAKKANNKNIQVHLQLTRFWLDKKDGGKALSAAREGLDATGRQEFQEFIGLAQLLQKDHTNALATFTRWAEVSPGNPMAHFRLAQAQIVAKDNNAALKSFDKALALRADFVDASLGKALLLGQLGRSAEAIKTARGIQSSNPKAAVGYLAEAEILLRDKHYLDAAKLYNKAAQISGQGQFLGRAYQAYIAAGQPGEGEKLLDQWLKTRPDDQPARHELAKGLLQTNRLKESADNYRILARANPKDLIALNNLAWLLGELKDPSALGIAEQAFKLAPNDPGVLDTYGWLLTQSGQAKLGLPHLSAALKTSPNNPVLRWHVAVALEKTGDKQGAINELDRLLTSRMPFPEAAQARALLEQLKRSAR